MVQHHDNPARRRRERRIRLALLAALPVDPLAPLRPIAAASDARDRRSWQLLETRRAAGVSRGEPLSEPAAASAVHEQYVWSERHTCLPDREDAGRQVDAPILRDRETDPPSSGNGGLRRGGPETGNLGRGGSGLDERLYYLTDAHMNVTAVVDTSGAVVERYAYDPPSSAGGGLRRAGPYGRATILDGATGGQTDWAVDADQSSDVSNEVLWCGYRRDAETGLYHVRRRMYHPLLGRWLQRDPIGYVDGMSLHKYVVSSAVSRIDPRGFDNMPDPLVRWEPIDIPTTDTPPAYMTPTTDHNVTPTISAGASRGGSYDSFFPPSSGILGWAAIRSQGEGWGQALIGDVRAEAVRGDTLAARGVSRRQTPQGAA